MKLKLIAIVLFFSFSAKSQGFYTDINLDTLNIFNSDGKVESPDELKLSKVRIITVERLDTIPMYLGILRVDTVDFPKYYPDANYYMEGELTLLLRVSPELGYKVGYFYFDRDWKLIDEQRIIFKLKQ